MAAAARRIAGFSFAAREGYAIGDENARLLGQRFVTLAGDGEVTPEQVVSDARDLASPLHSFFDWNDKSAAEKQRLERARFLIRAVAIQVTYEGGERERTRAFHSVRTEEGRGYATMPRVMARKELREQVIADAKRELDGWMRRFGSYEALGDARTLVRKATEWLRKAGES